MKNQPRNNTDTLLSVAAVITSVCAVIITLYQSYLQRTQQYASVIPILETYYTFKLTDNRNGFGIVCANRGLGPAFIDATSYVYQKKQYQSLSQVLVSTFTQTHPKDSTLFESDLYKGSVIPQGETRYLLETSNPRMGTLLSTHLSKLIIRIEYHSIYGQKWVHTFPYQIGEEFNKAVN